MKIVQAIAEKPAIHDFVMSQWQTDEFRASHRNKGFVYDLVEDYAYLPRIFATMTNDHLERSHFSSWWGVTMIREYDNPYIHDLYMLHEMYHSAYMPYMADLSFKSFDEKMQRNELEASVFSEIQIYFEMPGIRSHSFDQTIYADQFLGNAQYDGLYRRNKQLMVEAFRTYRREIMTGNRPAQNDTEMWIRRFSDMNTIHSMTWAEKYAGIEDHMELFQCKTMYVSRPEALAFHINWIEAEAALDSIDNIPFRAQAEKFAPYYWANK